MIKTLMGKGEISDSGTTGTINFNSNDNKVENISSKVHQLPCCIKFDGHSSVSHYFRPKSTGVEIDGLSVEEAHFRGRKLQGTKIPIPQGYSGFVLGKRGLGKRKSAEGNSDCWEVKAKFENITYWNHDDVPSKDDSFMRCFHLFAVSNALHKPVTAEDLASASISAEKS